MFYRKFYERNINPGPYLRAKALIFLYIPIYTNPAPILDPMAVHWRKMCFNCLKLIELYLRNVTKPQSDILIDT